MDVPKKSNKKPDKSCHDGLKKETLYNRRQKLYMSVWNIGLYLSTSQKTFETVNKAESEETMIKIKKLNEHPNAKKYIDMQNKKMENNKNTDIDQLWKRMDKSIKQAIEEILGFEQKRSQKNCLITNVK